jgi:formamidopyrimidine-DNA glycosylase
MPELPEVETTCRGLVKRLLGARIERVELHRHDLRLPLPHGLAGKLQDRRITALRRRAKYIVMELDDGHALLLHLGMSGRLVIGKLQDKTEKHDHVVIHCDRDRTLRFNDPRRFGMLDYVAVEMLSQHKLLKQLGVEPLEDGLTTAYLQKKFDGKKTPMKAALLDQRIIAGLGNIYVCEVLFLAGISPFRLAKDVTLAECRELVPAIRKVLNAAIAAGGSSLRDYVQADGALGFFQDKFSVYDREGQPCPRCLNKIILVQRASQCGRSSFFCSSCQR